MMPNEPNTTIGKIHCKALKTCNIQTCQKSIDVTSKFKLNRLGYVAACEKKTSKSRQEVQIRKLTE